MNFLLTFFIFSNLWHTTTPSKVDITLEIKSLETYEVQTEQGMFISLDIAEPGMSAEVGLPMLPVIKKIIEIPEDADIKLEISAEETAKILDYPILPAQPFVPKIYGARSQFTMDKEFYSQDKFSPQKWAEIAGTGYIRGHRVAILKIYPVRYNPKQGKIIYCQNLKITLNILHPNIAKTQQILNRYASPPFEALAAKIIMNYGEYGKAVPSLPIGYLIICADTWYDEVLPLAQWKYRKGFNTHIIRTSEIPGGASANNIKSYIQDAYDNWLVPPTYVVLVGDTNTIPAFTGSETGSVTDLYYTTVAAGADYFPDVGIGRLSVQNVTQCTNIIEKILSYERFEFSKSNEWREWAYFIACDASGDWQLVHNTHNYCKQLWRQNGGECDSLYPMGGGGTPIATAINVGKSVVVYSGHGGVGSWGGPSFSQSQVQTLSNLDMYPLVCSHACLTGKFSDSECFGETWIRVPDKGACAFWGGSSLTYWVMDDTLERAMFDGLFTDSLTWLSGMMDRAKYKLYETWGDGGDDVSTLYYYEVYNLLGDPSMDIFTRIPETMVVNHPPEILAGEHTIEVNVETGKGPLPNALVCAATADTQFIGYTDASGTATLQTNITDPCTVWITCTHYNYQPSESYAIAGFPPGVIFLDPESIQVNTPTNVVVTVTDTVLHNPVDSVEIKICGWGLGSSLVDTTNAAGVCTLLVNAPYGEILGVTATKGVILDYKSLPVVGAQSFAYADIIPKVVELGYVDSLVALVQGDITGRCDTANFNLIVQGCGLDTSVTINDTTGSLIVQPLSEGELQALITKTGYEIYTEIVKVVSARGLVEGMVYDSVTSDPISANIEIYREKTHYLSVYADSINGYQIILPWDSYTFHVSNPAYKKVIKDISIDTITQVQNFELAPISGILIVDDASNGAADIIKNVLDSLGYETTLETAKASDPESWDSHQLLVWSAGENINSMVDSVQREGLINYTKEGRKLFIEGGEVGYDAKFSYPDIANQVLHITDWESDSSGDLVKNNPEHLLTNNPNMLPDTILCNYLSWGDQDALVPDSLCDLVYGWTGYPTAGGILAHEQQMVFFSFDIKEINDRYELIENAVNFLIGAPGVMETDYRPSISKIYYVKPNPFNSLQRVALEYQIKDPGERVVMKVYDLSGRLIKTLINEEQKYGHYVTYWSGKDERGRIVCSGVYFLRFETPSYKSTQKIIFLR